MSQGSITADDVILSVQRALWGEVFWALRVITAEVSTSALNIWAYVDGPLSEEDEESLSSMCTEVLADFWHGDGFEFHFEVVRVDAPQPVLDTRIRAYERREDT